MPIIRTPDERFDNLPDFPFAPHYIEIDGKRIHYISEGTGNPMLFLHGEPTWSFLYRKVIPIVAKSYRALAFDFIGFGRSDKLTDMGDYSFDLHCHTLLGFIETLDLKNITLVVHDWGGLIGLPTALEIQERIDHLVILNTFLPTAEESPSHGFLAWRRMVERVAPDLPVAAVMQQTIPNAPAEVIAGYEAPFPSVDYKAGAAKWPLLVPTTPDDPIAKIMKKARTGYANWTKPTLVMFAKDDPILGGAAPFFKHLIPSAEERHFESGGHFLQEIHGEAIGQHIVEFISQG